MSKGGGLFALAPAAVFLAVSFFVLLAANKTDAKGLKTFGYAIAILLWISAALVLSAGISGHCPMMKSMKHGMMGGGGMMHEGMPMMAPEKK